MVLGGTEKPLLTTTFPSFTAFSISILFFLYIIGSHSYLTSGGEGSFRDAQVF